MIKRFFPLIIFVLSDLLAFSQAGRGVYQFLDLPVSSRMAAMGGANVSLRDNDLNYAFQNPSLLTAETNNTFGLNMANYLSDIQFGSFTYGKTIGTENYCAIGIQYVDYGTFLATTELSDSVVGEFTAKDYSVSLIYARPLTNEITVGATLKPIYSALERYTSYGVAMDAGIHYNDSAALFSAGLVLRNLGTQIKGYYSDENGQHFEALPFNIQLGLTKKLAHAPLRLSLTLHNLQQWNLQYQSNNQSDEDKKNTEIGFVDMAFRHTIVAVEFVPTKSFYLTASYNHRRQKEMSISGFKSMSGFSFGGGIKLYKFHVGFSRSQLQVGNYSYQFSISTSLNEFRL